MGIRMTNIATPMPQLRAKFTSKLGIPLSGCKVYTYEPNSDIPKKTWRDIDKSVENTNPIQLDAAGEADIYGVGFYRVLVKDFFGLTIYDVEKTGIAVELDASFVVDGDNTQQQINDITTQNTPSISSLRLFKPRKDGQAVNVLSHRAGFNLGGGLFKWDSTNTQADNNFNIIAVSGITTGRFVRVQSSKLASIEDAGGLSGEDCSVAVQTLHDAGITVVSGEVGATYVLKDVVVSHKFKFKGDYTLTKPALADTMIKPILSRYDLVFDGVEIDGKYAGLGAAGGQEILVSGGSVRGLVIRFNEVELSNISKSVLHTGYYEQGMVQSIQVKDCTSNGQHKPRAFSELDCLFSVHNAGLFSVDGFTEIGTGIFDIAGSDASDIISMPMPFTITTNTRLVGKGFNLLDGGGIMSYSGGHNSTISDSVIENCAYGWRVQNARNCVIKESALRRIKVRGAVLYQPYARLNTSTASVKEENILGFTIKNVSFEDCNGDISIGGSMIYANSTPLVTNPRARKVLIDSVVSRGCTNQWLGVQDGDGIEIKSTHVSGCTATRLISFSQSAANGAGVIDIHHSEFDAGGRNQVLISDPNSTLTTKQPTTKLFVHDGVVLKGFTGSVSPIIYLKYAGIVAVENIEYQGKPLIPVQFNEHNLAIFRNVTGLTYPASIANGNNVNFFWSTIDEIQSDHLRTTQSNPSEFVHLNTSAPTYTQLALGSVAKLQTPLAGGNSQFTFTGTGWKGSGAIQA